MKAKITIEWEDGRKFTAYNVDIEEDGLGFPDQETETVEDGAGNVIRSRMVSTEMLIRGVSRPDERDVFFEWSSKE